MMLYIVRHAWAGEFGDPAYPDDELRPLTDEGRVRFGNVVDALAERDFSPRKIYSSPLVRCRQTAEVIASRIANHPPVVLRDELMPGSDLEGLVAHARGEDVDQMAWVGHAPDVGDMTAALVGDKSGLIRFAKGAIAALRFADRPAIGEAELRWLVTAKILGV